MQDALPCPPGRGCKGGDPDVPTSVIFPYRRPDISDAPGISDISGTSGVVSGISGVASEDVSRAGGGGGVADAGRSRGGGSHEGGHAGGHVDGQILNPKP